MTGNLDDHGSRPSRHRTLLLGALLVALAASARVAIESSQGLVHAGADLGEYYIPSFAWWWRTPRWLGGWNPWLFGGYPGDADPEIGQLHPLGLLYAVFSPLTAAALEGAIGPSLAALGMFAYLRAIGCRGAAGLIGALSYGLGGFVVAHAPHPSVVRTAFAVPWALAAIEACEGAGLIAALGVSSALILLGGHPQVVVYGAAIVVLYALCFGRIATRGRALAIASGFALGAGVAAGALLPAAQLIALSTRWLGVSSSMEVPHLTLGRLPTLFVPFAEGGSTGFLYGYWPRFDGWIMNETTGYPGMLVWLLVLSGLATIVRHSRGRFWLGVALVALLLGANAANTLLPIQGVRAPARLLLWWNLAAAAMAAIVLRARGAAGSVTDADASSQAARRAPAELVRREWSWWAAVALIAAIIAWTAAGGRLPRRAAAGSAAVLVLSLAAVHLARLFPRSGATFLVAVTLVDLVAFDASFPVGVTRAAYERTGRALALVRDVRQRNGLDAGAGALGRSVVTPVFFGASWASLAGTRLVQGTSSLALRSVAILLGQAPVKVKAAELGDMVDGSLASPQNRVLDLLRCGLVIALPDPFVREDRLGEAIELVAERERLAPDGSRWQALAATPPASPGVSDPAGLRSYLNRRALPVAWLVERMRLASPEDALRLLRGVAGGAAFDPAQEALSDVAIPGIDVRAEDSGAGPSASSAPAEPHPVTVLAYGEDEIRLVAESPRAGLLVTSEVAYPGWLATIDDIQAPLRTVNFGFRAVVVPAGRHEVTFRYRPLLDRIGLAISGLSAVLLASACVTSSRLRSKRRSRSAPLR